MRKIFLLIVMTLLASSFCFATNTVQNKKNVIAKEMNYKMSSNLLKTASVNDGWYATCYVTVTNLETGEVRRIYGFGFGATKADALANCGKNARNLAHAQYAAY